MADQYERPYLDANVGDHLFTLARDGIFSVLTSVLTLAEVYKLRSGPVLEGDDGDRILAFFEHDFFRLIDVDRGISGGCPSTLPSVWHLPERRDPSCLHFKGN